MHDKRQGIVHIIGPEQGMTLPGMTVVCGDSHTSTHGALGCLAFGIGTSEIEHVLATQCLSLRRAKTLKVDVQGALRPGVGAKDLILALIHRLGDRGWRRLCFGIYGRSGCANLTHGRANDNLQHVN